MRRIFNTPWLSPVGWMLLGMLLDQGFTSGNLVPAVLASAALIGLAVFVSRAMEAPLHD